MDKLKRLARKGEINENAAIRDSHAVVINAPIEVVWTLLSDLSKWPEWNPEIKQLTLDGKLQKGATFRWTQGHTRGKSQIQAFEEPTLLSWTSYARLVKRIYVWSLEADENQTIATLSASFQGFFVPVTLTHQKVYDELTGWLDRLKNKAEEI